MQFIAKNNDDNDNTKDIERAEDEEEEEEEEKVECNKDFLKEFLNNKPKEFIEFLNNNDIPLDSYNVKDIPRFIRIKQKEYENSKDKNLFIKSIEEDLGTKLIPIKWLPYFYKFENSNATISSTKSYKSGIIYGMDASSGAAILALNPKPGDNVLDICCAPGTKLCMISDMLGGNGTVSGVDISSNRLGSCKTILKKYKIPNVRLFCSDGTTFDSLAPNKNDPIPKDIVESRKKQKQIKKHQKNEESNRKEEIEEIDEKKEEDEEIQLNNNNNNNNNNNISNNKKRKINKRSSKKAIFDLKDLYFCNEFYMRYSSSTLYDKVIVDAECSLDASIRHLIKHSKMGRYYAPEKSKQLTELQKGLIDNGFKLVKVGGHLVYSTCSFCKEQNEEIVQFLLNKYKDSIKLIPAFQEFEKDNNSSNKEDTEEECKIPYSIGYIPNTFRFYPKNGTSGMFISKFEKIK
ncbi:hypothetical protein DICPUDRAFT_76769 [Dictyostelium purpureum]|uniref:SAM-dependent MTase RsmB/NOP-type domain-containing protein n=1 Tax=Dictyostelium purpureum TaxID=5786 RepID=F0ZEK4_DICPU|nr:uncharacterized protein DICPUDRAFT_76769 [Dictyostelium purpureum]EGC37643.1 hypothetical protein DICPUDRAFT_76769 [Dictyostelium purpureum]|eukprot:XP_003285831.1 hypothetical protein DICPUDRAFT_76769 [Dictyostelium purpureum]